MVNIVVELPCIMESLIQVFDFKGFRLGKGGEAQTLCQVFTYLAMHAPYTLL